MAEKLRDTLSESEEDVAGEESDMAVMEPSPKLRRKTSVLVPLMMPGLVGVARHGHLPQRKRIIRSQMTKRRF